MKCFKQGLLFEITKIGADVKSLDPFVLLELRPEENCWPVQSLCVEAVSHLHSLYMHIN
jgi:hypothetical protein